MISPGRCGPFSPARSSTWRTAPGCSAFPSAAGDLVRPGLMLYGCSPLPEHQGLLRPVLTWKTRIALVREVGPGRGVSYGRTFITPRPMRLATLAVAMRMASRGT